MRLTRFLAIGLSFLAVGVTTSSYAGAFTCTRHIYNHSDTTWTFQAKPIRGAVHFHGISCPTNGPCQIPPGAAIEAQYTYDIAVSRGSMYITDYLGKTKSFSYNENEDYECPHVEHDGRTGAVSVNDPTRGDFKVDKGRQHW